jgi:hypothetical protein
MRLSGRDAVELGEERVAVLDRRGAREATRRARRGRSGGEIEERELRRL